MTISGGGETRVNTFTDASQYEPSITALSDGGWVVTWSSNGQDGSGRDVFQQAYDTKASQLSEN